MDIIIPLGCLRGVKVMKNSKSSDWFLLIRCYCSSQLPISLSTKPANPAFYKGHTGSFIQLEFASLLCLHVGKVGRWSATQKHEYLVTCLVLSLSWFQPIRCVKLTSLHYLLFSTFLSMSLTVSTHMHMYIGSGHEGDDLTPQNFHILLVSDTQPMTVP